MRHAVYWVLLRALDAKADRLGGAATPAAPQTAAAEQMAGADLARLQDYIDPLIRAIPAALQLYFESPVVNAIVARYAKQCQQRGFEISVWLALLNGPRRLRAGICTQSSGTWQKRGLETCKRMEEGRQFIV